MDVNVAVNVLAEGVMGMGGIRSFTLIIQIGIVSIIVIMRMLLWR